VSEISSRIRDFISTEIMLEDTTSTLTDETPLLGGVIDSLGLMQLISFLEEDFNVAIDDAEVTAENFRTVSHIEKLVSQKVQVG
jgi:acyl carrier protein